jgi:hypothetical protein
MWVGRAAGGGERREAAGEWVGEATGRGPQAAGERGVVGARQS